MRAALFLLALATVARSEDAPKPTAHESRSVEGWAVLVDARLLTAPNDTTGRRALALLHDHLRRINDAVAADRLEKLHAVTNQMEFFAEMSECYFGTNDFFPFVNGELKEAEPEVYALLREVWGPPSWEKPGSKPSVAK